MVIMEQYAVSPEVQNVMDLLFSSSEVKKTLEFLEADHEKRIADQIDINQVVPCGTRFCLSGDGRQP